MFPQTSFSGGLCLSENGFDLLSRLLRADPAQVQEDKIYCCQYSRNITYICILIIVRMYSESVR